METRYSSIEKELRDKGHIVFTNVGVSMMPLLRQNRDLMIIESRDKYGDPTVSDAVLFKRGDQLILHRIIGIQPPNYIICGDNQYVPEVVHDNQIIGILTGFVRDGIETRIDDPAYQKYVRTIMRRSMAQRKLHVRADAYIRAIRNGAIQRRLKKIFH